MKKLLYTLLVVSIIFSACKKEEEEPTNNTNNNNSGNTTNLAIGDTHQGGIIFYLDASGGGLIAAPSDQSSDAEWGCSGTAISGADGMAIGTGYQNTIDIEAGCTTLFTAADICANLTLGGYSDWFLPSKDELNEMYVNLHQQGLGDFANSAYWNSTEPSVDLGNPGLDISCAWSQNFQNGSQSDGRARNNPSYVRAVRRF
mgnify:CR=1 FL=1